MKGIFRLKLGAIDGMSRKKLTAWLDDAAAQTNTAKNAMLWYWMQWRREHPDWEPQQRTDRKGNPKAKSDGTPLLEPWSCSQQLAKAMYHFGREINPRLSSKILSQAWSDLLGKLKDRVPYNHEGTARYVWEAMLRFERSLDTYRSQSVPVPNQESCLLYRNHCSRKLSTHVDARLRKFAGSSAAIRFPLWSRTSGHAVTDVIVRVNVGKMSVGHRQLLARVARGELKFSDSELVRHRSGRWYLHLCYEVPIKDLGLDKERVATLQIGKERAFLLVDPDGKQQPIGSELALGAEYKRLEIRRKAIRHKSRNAEGRGRGKKKFYAKLRPLERGFIYAKNSYRNHFADHLVKACIRLNCGKVLYREPTMPLRDKTWFAEQGVPFDWIGLLGKIEYTLGRHSIEVETKRMGMAEWRGEVCPVTSRE